MTKPSKIFRIFVSSTFDDMIAERNALQEQVFPKLRELCMQLGCRFQAIDLRWGVSEEASLDQQTIPICLQELRRCQEMTPRPNLIILLGDRYGWCPLSPQIKAEELDEILSKVSDKDKELLLRKFTKLPVTSGEKSSKPIQKISNRILTVIYSKKIR